MESSKVFTSESGEVFGRQALSLSSDGHKARGKPRRRERVSKPKTAGQKVRRHHDILAQIKAKERLLEVSKENDTRIEKNTVSLITSGRITQKLGITARGKASETVTRRKALGDIKCSNYTEAATDHDLKRVLGLKPSPKQCGSSQHRAVLSSVQQCKIASPPHTTTDGEASCTEMECSPPRPLVATKLPIRQIALRLADGLHPQLVFPGTNYLRNAKAELRKLMKQSDPDGYSQLMHCLKGDPMLGESPTTQQQPTPHCFSLQQTRPPASAQDAVPDSLTLATLFGMDNSSHSHSISDHQTPDIPDASHSHPPVVLMPQDTSLLCPLPPPSFCPTSSMDFLDLLDSNVLSHPVVDVSTQPLQSKPSPRRWMPTPDRPKMFPHKLY